MENGKPGRTTADLTAGKEKRKGKEEKGKGAEGCDRDQVGGQIGAGHGSVAPLLFSAEPQLGHGRPSRIIWSAAISPPVGVNICQYDFLTAVLPVS